ncbi:hypothetical protein [Tuwongella immobilis]|uniref:Uncharacterized protein n=1 Tax=Tuwongella immobilis TaxID=692036 RepID=A0A6C2YJP7_9BACT|nr:hypothetical protein [Tuwongella immobilis]VIP01333.1 unnamed protein product [Tuwongella immobilis]VTR98092.1 unnamed protein product [Tuwongella immobilis]
MNALGGHSTQPLHHAWEQYAQALETISGPQLPLAQRFRQQVLDLFPAQPPEHLRWDTALADTLRRATALAAWEAWAPPRLPDCIESIQCEQDRLLADDCRRTLDALAQPSGGGSFLGRVLSAGNETAARLESLRQLVTRCEGHLRARGATHPTWQPLPERLLQAAVAVQSAIDALPADSVALRLADEFRDLELAWLPQLLEPSGEFIGPIPEPLPVPTDETVAAYLHAEGLVRVIRLIAEQSTPPQLNWLEWLWPRLREPLVPLGWWPRAWDGFPLVAGEVPRSQIMLREHLRLLIQELLPTDVAPTTLQQLWVRWLIRMLPTPVVPTIDPIRLRPIIPNTETPTIQIDYIPSERPFRRILSVERWADEFGPARVQVSLGPNAMHWERWLQLPIPAGLPAILHETLSRIRLCLQSPGLPDPTTEMATAFRGWLATEPGEEWLNSWMGFARHAMSQERIWLQFLMQQGWLEFYPRWDFETGLVEWPDDHPLPAALQWEFADAALRAILRVERFSVVPSRCRLVLSQGTRREGSQLATCHDFAEWLLQLVPSEHHLLQQAVTDRDQLRHGQPLEADPARLMRYLDGWWQLVPGTNWARLAPEEQPRYGQGLDALRAWIRSWDEHNPITILPIDWRFDMPTMWHESQNDRQEASFVYRRDEPRGRIFRIRQFGWQQAETIHRKAQVSVSVGVAPLGLTELEAVLQPPLSDVETTLRQRLQDWRKASLDGDLERVALQLFADFWDQLFDPFDSVNRERAHAVADRLREVMQQELGFAAFYPKLFQEQPEGWIEVAEGTRMRTGRVLRVLRPGLVDREGQLMLPARVEVD